MSWKRKRFFQKMFVLYLLLPALLSECKFYICIPIVTLSLMGDFEADFGQSNQSTSPQSSSSIERPRKYTGDDSVNPDKSINGSFCQHYFVFICY